MDDETGGPRRHTRLGSDEVTMLGLPREGWRDAYHRLLTVPTPVFLASLALAYLLVNAAFGGLYMLDPKGVANARPGVFWDYFFFSVQTLGTLGYGVMSPRGPYANILVTTEVFTGLLNLGVATGLLFARISRPTARIMFSDKAVVTPLNGTPTLMLRAANRRRNLVLEAEVSLTLAYDVVTQEGDRLRRFEELTPVRARTPLFFLTWQIMHRIDENSPLNRETAQSLIAKRAELLVVLRGLDETFVSTIHARASYLPHEIVWGQRFADILTETDGGRRVVDFTRFHDLNDGA
jgi:inward rectifier potassium channel